MAYQANRPACGWIFSGVIERPVRRCHMPVGFRMVVDDDGRLVRRYEAFCPEHAPLAAAMDAEEEAGYGHGV